MRNRLKKGDSAIHIVSDLVMKLEEEARNHEKQQSISDEDKKHFGNEINNGESGGDLTAFDQLTKYGTNDTHLVECAGQEWFAIHLSAAFGLEDPSSSHIGPQDF